MCIFFWSLLVDLGSWQQKIEEDLAYGDDAEEEEEAECSPEVTLDDGDSTYQKHEAFRDGVLTLGCCGVFATLLNSDSQKLNSAYPHWNAMLFSRLPQCRKVLTDEWPDGKEGLFLEPRLLPCHCESILTPPQLPCELPSQILLISAGC